MGSRIGPIATRYGLAALAALALAGCANSNVQVSGGGPQPTVNAQGNTALGRFVLLAFVAGIGYESYKDGTRYRANPFDALQPGLTPLPPPPLDPARKVLEQDCTQPIIDWSVNLRCK
jgi:hypothetical protein